MLTRFFLNHLHGLLEQLGRHVSRNGSQEISNFKKLQVLGSACLNMLFDSLTQK